MPPDAAPRLNMPRFCYDTAAFMRLLLIALVAALLVAAPGVALSLGMGPPPPSIAVSSAATLRESAKSLPSATTYPVTFSETGLPSGTSWTVTLNLSSQSSTSTSIIFREPSGSYAYNISDVHGWHQTSLPYYGKVIVANASLNETPLAFVPVTYLVSFNESGLTAGTNWSVTYNGLLRYSHNVSIGFAMSNGTYAFNVTPIPGYFIAPSSGNQTVSGGPVTKPIKFNALLPPQYSVTFSENGLPSGLIWGIAIGNQTLSTMTNQITTSEFNGSYRYGVQSPTGFSSSPSGGLLGVSGKPVLVQINFTRIGPPPGTYVLTFSESGLPGGTVWQVTINSHTNSSGSTSISFEETNGTYAYAVGPENGYNATPSHGNVSIAGHALSVFINFMIFNNSTQHPGNHTQPAPDTFLGLPTSEAYLLIAILLIIVIVAVALAARSSSRDEAPPRRPHEQEERSSYPGPSSSPSFGGEVPVPPKPPASVPLARSTGVPVSVVVESEIPPSITSSVPRDCPVCRVPMGSDLKCPVCGIEWSEKDFKEIETKEGSRGFTGFGASEKGVHGDPSTPSYLGPEPSHTESDLEWEKQMGLLHEESKGSPATSAPPSPPPPENSPREPEKVPAAPFLLAFRSGRGKKKKRKSSSSPKTSDGSTPYIGLLPFSDDKGEPEDEEEHPR